MLSSFKGADTVVTLGGIIYGKPADEEAARETLSQLSGRTHSVYTGVKLIFNYCGERRTRRFYEVTEVRTVHLRYCIKSTGTVPVIIPVLIQIFKREYSAPVCCTVPVLIFKAIFLNLIASTHLSIFLV
jgi:Maf-like protein